MLQNASIKTKLGAILLLPLLCLGVLAGLRVADNLTRGPPGRPDARHHHLRAQPFGAGA